MNVECVERRSSTWVQHKFVDLAAAVVWGHLDFLVISMQSDTTSSAQPRCPVG